MIRRLFNNRYFVIGLAACSLMLMLTSIGAPFLERPEFDDAEDPDFYLLAEETADEDQPVVVRPGRSVLSGLLTWNDSPRRDPFSPVSGDTETVVRRSVPMGRTPVLPRLDALVAGPESLLAVLDDRIVRVGDRIGEYRVERIRENGVLIASVNRSHWLAIRNNTPEGHR